VAFAGNINRKCEPILLIWRHRALHRQQPEPDTRFLRSAAHHEPPAASLVVKPAAVDSA
jgi:hypothetical protein